MLLLYILCMLCEFIDIATVQQSYVCTGTREVGYRHSRSLEASKLNIQFEILVKTTLRYFVSVALSMLSSCPIVVKCHRRRV